jgi:hypothetical protein
LFLQWLSKKRNATSYDAAGSVSDQELLDAIKVASERQRGVRAWLQERHPELL